MFTSKNTFLTKELEVLQGKSSTLNRKLKRYIAFIELAETNHKSFRSYFTYGH